MEWGDPVRKKANILYGEGYRKALMDLYELFNAAESNFRSDRKRNNVKNVLGVIQAILEDVDTFATYGKDTPISFEVKDKGYRYYISKDWPVSM